MTETQVLTAVTSLATVAILFSTWRIADLRDSISQALTFSHEALRAEVGAVRKEMELTREAIRAEMAKNHSELLSRIADVERKQETRHTG